MSVHLPAFLGYEVYMAHSIQGEQERSQKNCNHCENNAHGSCGHCGRYVETPQGLHTFKTIFAEQTNDKFKRCCYKAGTNLRRHSPNTVRNGRTTWGRNSWRIPQQHDKVFSSPLHNCGLSEDPASSVPEGTLDGVNRGTVAETGP